MSEQIEIEFKTMLTKKEYLLLLQYFKATEDNFFQQENCYFDTPDWKLKNKNSGLRIRLLPNKAELTLKTPFQEDLMETTDDLSLLEAQSFIQRNTIKTDGYVASKLKELGIPLDEIQVIGSLKTKRFEHSVEKGMIVLDQSFYNGITDYELEFETVDRESGYAFFKEFLQLHHIPERKAKNKIRRMIESNEG